MRDQTISYDGDLQMFVERPRDPDLARLRFLRWLNERRPLEHASRNATSSEYITSALAEPRPAA